ncbi:GSCOCG00011190001-RA-CDS [Cotesia congregata]|nr:GSCOCG00011190001-RA-CDS [Cotesia congregata]
MLKHISSGQPGGSGGSRNQNHEYPTISHFGSSSTTSRGISLKNDRLCDPGIYDSLHSVHPSTSLSLSLSHPQKSASVHRHPLNHSQLSVNNLSARFTHSHHLNALNLSALSASKHSIDSPSPDPHNHHHHHHHHQLFHNNHNNINYNPKNINNINNSNNNPNNINNNANNTNNNNNNNNNKNNNNTNNGQIQTQTQVPNGGLDISRLSRLASRATPSPLQPAPVATINAPVSLPSLATTGPLHTQDTSWSSFCLKGPSHQLNGQGNARNNNNQEPGVKEMLTFLGLLCLVSLLLAMLSHIFLLKISPVSTAPSSVISPEEYTIVYEVTLALCALAMSLNLCCLLVCAIQFLFAMKLVKSAYNQNR